MGRWMVLCLCLAGCGAAPLPEERQEELGYPTSFDINSLLTDDDVRGGAGITVDEVQQFLTAKGSYLATYTDPAFKQTAATLIVEQARAEGISPLYMMARIQTESSLIESGSSAHLAAATGCGCPDSGGCSQSYAGFGNQVQCGAKLLAGYFASLDAGKATIAGWSVGKAKQTSDPCSVTPANKATAALYTYTPWVGAYGKGCGRSDVGGSSLVALIYSKYASQQSWTMGTTTPADPCAGLVDGKYCGGDGIGGDAGTLYTCQGGMAASTQVCGGGCKWNPPGTPDACNPKADDEDAPAANEPTAGSGCAVAPGRTYINDAGYACVLGLVLLALALRRRC
jgi:hypothetical protein